MAFTRCLCFVSLQYGRSNLASSPSRVDVIGGDTRRPSDAARHCAADRQRGIPRDTQAVAFVRSHTLRSFGK